MSETTTARIAAIPADELLTDFHEASKDLQAAEIAVKAGEVQYRYRIDGNKKQLQVIQGEIKRRIEVSDDLLAACKAAQRLIASIHPMMRNAKIKDHVPYGLDEQVINAAVNDALGLDAAIAKAKARAV